MAKRAFRLVIVILVLGVLVPTAALSQERSDVDFFKSDGVMIRFLDVGSGDPVLLIHGFGSRLEFWEAAGILSELEAAECARLQRRCRPLKSKRYSSGALLRKTTCEPLQSSRSSMVI